jgi:Ca2+-binding EF-hand superfamily protein
MKKTTLAIAISLIATTAYAGMAAAEPGPGRGDGVTTRAEAQAHAAEMFAKMDANKDGKLDPADRAAHQAAMFDRLDANKDGSVSRDEFANARPERGHGAERGDERRERGARMGRRGGGERMGMMLMHMADTDKDGSVTQAELTSAALAHFDKTDANKDGQVTRDERRAARQQMREQMGKMRGSHQRPAG